LLIDCLTARDSCSRCDAGERTGKIAYFEDHVSYDVVMLNYTFMRLMTLQPSTPEEQLDCNAFLESFGVQARNLVDFFSEKPREEGRNASDYVSDFEAPDQTRLKQALARLERQILDVTLFDRRIHKRSSTPATRVSFTPGSCRRSLDFRGSLARHIARASMPSGLSRR
jgi:hypothetical protein